MEQENKVTQDNPKHEQKVALVIGASSGIGFHTAKKLADRGIKVYCGSRTPCPDERVTSISLDVTYPQTVAAAVSQIVEQHGAIHALIYSAGYSMAAPVEYAREEDYRHLFEVNYFGAINAVKQVLPVMRLQGGGRIVLVSSMGGTLPIAFDSFYSSSKAALNMLARELNVELKPYNISVSALMPGGTATRFTFKRKVYEDSEAHGYAENMNRAVVALANIEQGGMAPEAVAETLIKLLNTPNPPELIASGLTNKTYLLSQKILPSRLTQFLNNNQYNQMR